MGGKSSAPAPPDPYAVSNAQTQTNQQTAQYNANLNRYNQYTPYGSETWSQSGTNPDGSPKWSSNISLTPTAQRTLDSNMQSSLGMSQLMNQFQGAAGSQLGAPLNTSSIGNSNHEAQQAVYQRATSMLDPQYEQQQKQLSSQLAQQGITQGSDAYNLAQTNFARQRDSAYENARNDSITQGDQYGQQQLQQLLAIRNQPLDELNALRSGSQVQTPSFQSAGTVSAPASNLSGDIYNSYQGQLDRASSANAGSNAFMGGLFQLGGSALSSGMFNGLFSASDRRVKKDVERIGTRHGLPLYRFRYVWEDAANDPHVGHMADEVRARVPDAVVRGPEGFDLVNYARVEAACLS